MKAGHPKEGPIHLPYPGQAQDNPEKHIQIIHFLRQEGGHEATGPGPGSLTTPESGLPACGLPWGPQPPSTFYPLGLPLPDSLPAQSGWAWSLSAFSETSGPLPPMKSRLSATKATKPPSSLLFSHPYPLQPPPPTPQPQSFTPSLFGPRAFPHSLFPAALQQLCSSSKLNSPPTPPLPGEVRCPSSGLLCPDP